jgi:hypothetical protein
MRTPNAMKRGIILPPSWLNRGCFLSMPADFGS